MATQTKMVAAQAAAQKAAAQKAAALKSGQRFADDPPYIKQLKSMAPAARDAEMLRRQAANAAETRRVEAMQKQAPRAGGAGFGDPQAQAKFNQMQNILGGKPIGNPRSGNRITPGFENMANNTEFNMRMRGSSGGAQIQAPNRENYNYQMSQGLYNPGTTYEQWSQIQNNKVKEQVAGSKAFNQYKLAQPGFDGSKRVPPPPPQQPSKRGGLFGKGAPQKSNLGTLTKATMKKGGSVKKKAGTTGYKSGGKVSSASKRGDGCAVRGKTKGKIV